MPPLIRLLALLACLTVSAETEQPAACVRGLAPLSVRGVNYYPRDTPWGGMWTRTPAAVWSNDMARAAALRANAVRTFVSFSPALQQAGLLQADGAPTAAYLDKLDAFLGAAWHSGLRTIVCFDFDPRTLGAADAQARERRALEAVVGAHRDDGRVLLWDLMNEPDDDAKWTEPTRAYLRDAAPLVRGLDTNHLTTVGMTWRIDRIREVGLPDVIQYHEYCPKAVLFERGAARVEATIANQRRVGGARPLLIGEFGLCTARDPQFGAEEAQRAKIGAAPGSEEDQAKLYGIVLSAARQAHAAGVLAWCLYDYPIRNPDEAQFGLFRIDGSPKPAAAVLREAFASWENTP